MAHEIREPLIHIGYPKAASTWLQRYLFQPELGYAPLLGMTGGIMAFRWSPPFSFDPGQAREVVEKRASRAQLSEYRLVPVITSEHLSGRMERGGFDAEMLANRLHETYPEARVLILVREQRSMIRSLYSSMVRAGGAPYSVRRTLRPIAANTTPQFNLDYLCYDRVVRYYQQCFGDDRVLVLPCEMLSSEPMRFIERINAFSGAQMSRRARATLPTRARLNQRSALPTLWLARLGNRYLIRNGFDDSGWISERGQVVQRRVAIAKKLDKVVRRSFPARWLDQMEERFERIVSDVAAGRFAIPNRRLQALTGLDLGSYGYEMPLSREADTYPGPHWGGSG